MNAKIGARALIKARLVFILCGTYLTKNLAFWYKSYGFVDSIKFLRAKSGQLARISKFCLLSYKKTIKRHFFPAQERESATRQKNPVA
jgi:hypothetical protein